MKAAYHLFKSEWRSGEIALLMAALLLSIVVVTGLSLFINRLQIVLVGESHQFLAADRVLTSPRPVADAWLKQAETLSLQTTRHVSFQSMLYAEDEPQLVSVKAADDAYPLRGELKYRATVFGDLLSTVKGPTAGQIWIESRLFTLLDIKIGDEVYVGDAPLIVSAELVSEPDRGAGSISMGPRVLMHWSDIEKTAVVGEGSRLAYSYLFAGEESQLKRYVKSVESQLSDSEKWLDLESTQPTVAIAMNRAKSFFLLASSAVVILASIAIAMAGTQFSQRHVHQVAILKTLGASSAMIKQRYLQFLLLILLMTLPLGWLCAWLLQEVIVQGVANQLKVAPPAISIYPFFLGFVVASLSLLAFVLPPLLALKNISAVRILQSHFVPLSLFSRSQQVMALLLLWVMLFIYTEQIWLSSLLVLGLLLLCLLVALPAVFLLKRIGKVRVSALGWFTLAKTNLQRRLAVNALQSAVFAISFMMLLLILGVKNNLFAQWQSQLPEKTPNYFLVNIQDSQWQPVNDWLANHAVESEHLYPMVRARLIDINQKAVREFVSKEELSRAGADRELNLSWSNTLPQDNRIVEGEWIASAESTDNFVSIEQKIAAKLKIKVGDELTFMSGADRFSAKVSSIRSVEWDRMRPNFYILMNESQLKQYPKTYMTSFWLPSDKQALIPLLLKQFPTVVLIDIDVLIQQIRQIIHHVSLALELILVFVVIASFLVLLATTQQTLVERLHENTIIRAIGGTRRLIGLSVVAEFAFIGLIAGLIATIGAELLLVLIQLKVFDMPISLHPELWWIAPLLGVVLIGIAGMLSARKVLKIAPMQLLRQG